MPMQMQRQPNVLDLSHHNSDGKMPDFVHLKALGILGVIHKATQGLNYVDNTYEARRANAVAAGLLWGAYHFMDASDPIAQADHFVATSKYGDAPMLLAADYETSNSTPSLHQLLLFMRRVELRADGCSCVLYSGNLIRETLRPHSGGHQAADMVNAEIYFAKHRLWLAHYALNPVVPWPWSDASIVGPVSPSAEWLWQFSEKGIIMGLGGNVDCNLWRGTPEQLAASWVNGVNTDPPRTV